MKISRFTLTRAQIESALRGESVCALRTALLQSVKDELFEFAPIIHGLCRHSNDTIRAQALWALNRLSGSQYLEVYRAMAHDKDSMVRRHAAEGMGKHGDASDMKQLMLMRFDADKTVVEIAESAIAVLKGEQEGIHGRRREARVEFKGWR